ncbi:MAG: deoxyribodipyrimidine photo-lyase [Desulfovibrio sp.]
MSLNVNPKRVFQHQDGPVGEGPVVYWMSRDQRVEDNWALLYACQKALEHGRQVEVLFCLVPDYPNAVYRHYDFMLRGLMEVAEQLHLHGIGFTILHGSAPDVLPEYVMKQNGALLVTDFDPLSIKRDWLKRVVASVPLSVFEVDAHNVVPCRVVSQKQEYSARTIRPKIQKLLQEFLEPYPLLPSWDIQGSEDSQLCARGNRRELESILTELSVDRDVGAVSLFVPGAIAAAEVLQEFIKHRLKDYAAKRNDPNAGVLSDLSPYFHFGQISAQRAALEVSRSTKSGVENIEAFIEEGIVRRELSENFCFYNADYDKLIGCAEWAQRTLDEHRHDVRPYVYTLEEFENAATHSVLWNSAQNELRISGKMHGYMRMFWAKKILEWSSSPEDAVKIANFLNDRYSLDGRDPNGYTGVLWSIGGVHDRAWKERPIYGKIRYMNENGCRRKFDVQQYTERWSL